MKYTDFLFGVSQTAQVYCQQRNVAHHEISMHHLSTEIDLSKSRLTPHRPCQYCNFSDILARRSVYISGASRYFKLDVPTKRDKNSKMSKRSIITLVNEIGTYTLYILTGLLRVFCLQKEKWANFYLISMFVTESKAFDGRQGLLNHILLYRKESSKPCIF